MAFDLRARLRLDDRMSDPLRRIQRQTEQTQRIIDRLNRSTGATTRAMGSVNRETGRLSDGFRMMGRATKSIFSVKNAFLGVAAAIGGATTAKKVFDETIGAAARREQSTVTISAILNDKKLGKQYMDMINKFAIDSPIMNSEDMLANSKSFLTSIGKNMKQLEKAWSLAERMAAIDPMQGVEGAVFALRELFSGDAISMVQRFEMPRKVMNQIKKLPIKEQLKALDKYFNKIGMTQKLIDKMGNTSLGLWAQIKEKTQLMFANMGSPALQVIKKFLDEINKGMSGDKLSGFQKTGADILKNMTQGFINAVKGIGSWISYIQNSPKFKNSDLFMKVSFVFEDIGKRFKKWLKDGGQDKLNTAAKNIIEITSAAFLANQEVIITSIKSIGTAIGSALVSSTTDSMMKSFNNSAIGKYIPMATWMKWIANGGNYVREKIFGSGSGNKKKSSGTGNGSSSAGKFGPKPTSYASGLTRVPYDGYQATLHKNERVLTPEEAKEYNAGRGGGNTYQITVNVNGQLTDRRTVDKLLDAMVSKIQLAGGAGA